MAASGGTWTKAGGKSKGRLTFLPQAEQMRRLAQPVTTNGSSNESDTSREWTELDAGPLKGRRVRFDKDSVFTTAYETDPVTINGIAVQPAEDREYYKKTKDVSITDEPRMFVAKGRTKLSTGLILLEPDGRVWVYEPTNHYSSTQHTFPQGGLEPRLTRQQNALKELIEETGLQAKITGYLGDFSNQYTTTRYYVGTRIGGSPADAHWESQSVKLVDRKTARQIMNKSRDQVILSSLEQKLGLTKTPPARSMPKPGTVTVLRPGITGIRPRKSAETQGVRRVMARRAKNKE